MLHTEQDHPLHADLDLYPTQALVSAFIDDQLNAVRAVQAAAPVLAAAVDAATSRLAQGGRLIYVGAGTSGRLGMLDAAELPPTFSWPPERALAMMAGGADAARSAIEGAEDNAEAGQAALHAAQVTGHDVVLLIAASGRTPYALGALRAAQAVGALTVAIVNNPGSVLAEQAHHAVVLDTGPEVITGSTRLKAGTAQKIALNTFSSALMVRQHKVYRSLMVDMRPTNHKLHQRAIHMTARAASVSDDVAQAMLQRADHQVKVAIVALQRDIGPAAARAALDAVGGNTRLALTPPADPSTPSPTQRAAT